LAAPDSMIFRRWPAKTERRAQRRHRLRQRFQRTKLDDRRQGAAFARKTQASRGSAEAFGPRSLATTGARRDGGAGQFAPRKELVSSASLKARPAGPARRSTSRSTRAVSLSRAPPRSPRRAHAHRSFALTVQRDGQRSLWRDRRRSRLRAARSISRAAPSTRRRPARCRRQRRRPPQRHRAGRAVPLSIASIADPTLALGGSLDAEAHITGTKTAPNGDWKVTLARSPRRNCATMGCRPSTPRRTGGCGRSNQRRRRYRAGSASRVTIAARRR